VTNNPRQSDVVPKPFTGWPIETEPDGAIAYVMSAKGRPAAAPLLIDRDGARWVVTSGRHVPFEES